MKNTLIKIITLLKPYRWILLLIIPFVFFILVFLVLSLSPQSQNPPSQPPTPTGSQINLITITPEQISLDEAIEGYEESEGLDTLPGFQKKEDLNNGTIRYIYTSGNPSRPNIIIATTDNKVLFSRQLSSKDFPLATIPVYKEAYGEPEKIIQGSKTYGSTAVIYIYGSIGIAFIGNEKTGDVYEEHLFPRMSIEAYLQRFGDQN